MWWLIGGALVGWVVLGIALGFLFQRMLESSDADPNVVTASGGIAGAIGIVVGALVGGLIGWKRQRSR